jgi:pyrroline-5-carboxylate reductase
MSPGSPIPPILLVGAGRMGGAMFAGWAAHGLAASVLVDPSVPPDLGRTGDLMVPSLEAVPAGFRPEAVVLAIKPQMAEQVLPVLGALLPAGTMVLSILAGLPVSGVAGLLGGAHPVVRAMPNTPAAIGQGMIVAFDGPGITAGQHALARMLLAAVGEVAWVDDEDLIDPITSVSGCGPAYVFLLAELLERCGIEQGIPPALARQLARKTVSGAGALLAVSEEDSAALRRAVTSPHGVTERALSVLMDEAAWPGAIRAALAAAVARARELAGSPG